MGSLSLFIWTNSISIKLSKFCFQKRSAVFKSAPLLCAHHSPKLLFTAFWTFESIRLRWKREHQHWTDPLKEQICASVDMSQMWFWMKYNSSIRSFTAIAYWRVNNLERRPPTVDISQQTTKPKAQTRPRTVITTWRLSTGHTQNFVFSTFTWSSKLGDDRKWRCVDGPVWFERISKHGGCTDRVLHPWWQVAYCRWAKYSDILLMWGTHIDHFSLQAKWRGAIFSVTCLSISF